MSTKFGYEMNLNKAVMTKVIGYMASLSKLHFIVEEM
jgi:hypothetical protein